MTDDIKKGRVGGTFEDYLTDQGTYEATANQAIRRMLAFQLAAEMKSQGISKKRMAERLETSRSQLDRLLDSDNDSVTLAMLTRAAKAVGRDLRLELT